MGSILVKSPRLTIFAQHQPVTVHSVNPDADIGKGPEAKGLLHYSSVTSITMNGVALDEKTVALMLEVAKHLSLGRAPQQRQRTREADITGV